MLRGNAIVGQSGGPTAAINATLAGVIKGAFDCPHIDTVYGAFNGVEGMLADTICELNKVFANRGDLKVLAATPAAALGSCRKKLPKLDDEAGKATYEKLLEFFKAHNIRYFFYIGGNDSMDTVAKLTAYLADKDYEMRVMGVPKTIDNDLVGTDHTPGFGSAAKYIAATMQEILRDTAVYTVKAVTIVEIMGRDAGWLTASAGLTDRVCGVCADLIYLPERTFDMEKFIADVNKAFEKHPNVVVAVSEGVRFADGRYVGEGTQSGATDAFGHKYLSGTGKVLEQEIRDKIGCKVRSIELNLMQRCASHIASAADIEESQCVGAAAVMAAANGDSGKMMCYVRADDEYRITYESRDIAGIANKIKTVPDEYINAEGNGITEACVDYILPLIQGESEQFFENGLPRHFVIER